MRFIFTVLVLIQYCWLSAAEAADRRKAISSVYSNAFKKPGQTKKLGFSLAGQLGAVISSGNNDTRSFNGRLTVDHEMVNWSNQYSVDTLYTQRRRNPNQDLSTVAQRFNANIEADYKLQDPTRRVFLFADYEDDRFDGFEKQFSVAAGWAKLAIDSANKSFRYSLGPGYSFARPENEMDEDNTGFFLRLSAEYVYRWSTGARLRQSVSTSAGTAITLSRSETSVTTKIMGDLAMKLSFILDHNSSPGTDIEALDTRTSVSLVYQFF